MQYLDKNTYNIGVKTRVISQHPHEILATSQNPYFNIKWYYCNMTTDAPYHSLRSSSTTSNESGTGNFRSKHTVFRFMISFPTILIF